MHPHLPPRPYLTKGESRRRTCGGSGGGGCGRGEVAGCVYTWGRGSCLRAAQPHHGDGLPRLSPLTAGTSRTRRLARRCSWRSAATRRAARVKQAICMSWMNKLQAMVLIHNRADSQNAASAQSMGKIDP